MTLKASFPQDMLKLPIHCADMFRVEDRVVGAINLVVADRTLHKVVPRHHVISIPLLCRHAKKLERRGVEDVHLGYHASWSIGFHGGLENIPGQIGPSAQLLLVHP